MQLCACKELKKLKVEADFSAEPLWCAKCYTNLDIEDFSLSDSLLKASGVELTEIVKQQLPQFDVVFSPSTYAVRNQEV